MIDSLYSFEYFQKELTKKRKRLIELEDKLEEERNAYKKLIFQKAGWEYRLYKILTDSQQIPVEL